MAKEYTLHNLITKTCLYSSNSWNRRWHSAQPAPIGQHRGRWMNEPDVLGDIRFVVGVWQNVGLGDDGFCRMGLLVVVVVVGGCRSMSLWKWRGGSLQTTGFLLLIRPKFSKIDVRRLLTGLFGGVLFVGKTVFDGFKVVLDGFLGHWNGCSILVIANRRMYR